MNTGAPFPKANGARERVLHVQRKLHEWGMNENHAMYTWRAGCGGTRKSGSEGGREQTTGRQGLRRRLVTDPARSAAYGIAIDLGRGAGRGASGVPEVGIGA